MYMISRAVAIKVSDDLNKVFFLGKSSREPDHKRRGTTRGPISKARGRSRLLNYITQSVILIHSTSAKCRFSADPFQAIACPSFNTLLITKAIIDYPTGCRCSSSSFLPVPFTRTQCSLVVSFPSLTSLRPRYNVCHEVHDSAKA